MIKKLITSLMMLSDNGSLLKRPVKWLYSLMAFLSFVPVFVAIGVVINLWDELISLLGRGFWANFVSMFILDLALLALVLFGLVGYHFWKNRQKHLDSVIRAGSRNVAIPLVADINQSSGEINSLFLAIVPVTVAALAYLACLLTGGQEFYHDLNFLTWLLIIIAGAAALLLAAYLNLLLTRFVSERIRLLPFIGNDVQKIANGTPVSSEVNPSGSGSGFEFPKITRPEKLRVLGCVAGAALCGLLFALWISMSVGINYKKSVFEDLTSAQIERVGNVYPGFSNLYEDARRMAGNAEDLGQAAAYRKVTFKMIDNYSESYMDNEDFKEKIRASAQEKYEKTVHAPMLPKIAAAKEKWVKYLEEHDVDQYLKVETVTDYYKESGYYYDTFRPSFYFKVTEPKGSLSDAEVVFVPLNSYGNHHYSASATTVRLSSLKDMNESSPRHYTQVDDKSFWDDYTMDVTIKSVTLSGGKTLKATDKDNIPDEVKDYLENENESTELAFIKGQIDSGYMSRYDYCDQMLQEELRKKNPLCYDFLKKFD